MLVKGHGEAPVLRKPELDAFLATAMSPELRNVTYLAEMRLEMVTIRGVHLAAIFMQVLFNFFCRKLDWKSRFRDSARMHF